ncbi:MAG: glycosyltransferase, partial [Pleurocapsa sp.]
GKSYKSLDNIEKAIAFFQQVIEIAPHQDIGYISLAEVYHQQKQIKKAQRNWVKAIKINSQNKWATVSLGYSYIEEKQIELAEEFFIAKKGFFPNDFDFIFAFAHVYISKMDWKRAEEMMTEALALNPDSSEIKVRLLELCLYSGNLTQAYEYYLSLQDNLDDLPNSFYQAAAKLFSEQKNWALAFKYARKSVLIEPGNIHNHKLFIKTVRKSKKFQEALEFLLDPAILNEQNKNTILYLRIAIQEQLLKSIPEAQKVLSSNTIGLDIESSQAQLLQKRLMIKDNIFNTSIGVSSQLQTEIFYCTDLGYSLPTLVSLYSLYKHNKHKIRGKTIYVVANGETINIISKAYRKLAEQFNFEIELIDIGSLVQESIDNKLNTSYGVFTGGDSLSSTAYYRLFFSQFLREYGLSSRWLYIDSDTLIVNSIGEIDKLNFLGLPIAARQERAKPEVQKTIEQNNLQYGKYFNSGVIAFDAQHPDLSRLAANAVSVAINEGHRLLYHDQCALNIAFDGQIANLSTQFNDYYPPSDTRNIEELSLSSDSVILHLLDRPKPWDTLSYHKGSIVWFKMLEEISSFMPSSYILELFQLLQNTL